MVAERIQSKCVEVRLCGQEEANRPERLFGCCKGPACKLETKCKARETLCLPLSACPDHPSQVEAPPRHGFGPANCPNCRFISSWLFLGSSAKKGPRRDRERSNLNQLAFLLHFIRPSSMTHEQAHNLAAPHPNVTGTHSIRLVFTKASWISTLGSRPSD